jgi:hypothetical protein
MRRDEKGRELVNAAEHLRHDQWHGMQMLHEHQLLGEDYFDEGRGARWVIGKPGTFTFKCEIIAGIGGSLIVHGDFDVVRFGHYGDHADAFSRLCWMGYCYDVGYYVLQKASIGMGRRSSCEAYDEEVAKYDLHWHIADREEDEDHSAYDVFQEALKHTEDERTLRDFLNEHDEGWDLWELTLGRVVDSHVVIAHLALNKCVALLAERYGDAGPPACRPGGA